MNDNELEQLLLKATSRRAIVDDEEGSSLQQGFRALGERLERRAAPIEEAAIVEAVLRSNPVSRSVQQETSSEGWLAMFAVAAALLVFIGLGMSQSNAPVRDVVKNSPAVEPVVKPAMPTVEPESGALPPAADTEQLAWDDAWDEQLEEARDYAAELRLDHLTRMESIAWSAAEALSELQAELESM